MSDGRATATGGATPEPVDDLLAASPRTAYFWGRVAGDGEVVDDRVTVRTRDEAAADALAAITGADVADHAVEAHESAHDASIVRYEDEYELEVANPVADGAVDATDLPVTGSGGGYRLDAFADDRAQLVRGLLEACGTICFRESSGSVGISFVHDDEELLETNKALLADAEPHLPTKEMAETSEGGYWFGLADDADTAGFAEWVYAGSDASGLYSADRREKLRRSVERATGSDVGSLST